MELAATLLDFVLHVDRYLEMFVSNYGLWVYALLFLIIFVETGLVIMPFLPGDSLLFVVGAMLTQLCMVRLPANTTMRPTSVGMLLRWRCIQLRLRPTCPSWESAAANRC
jgi:hypothetical protein